jgi:methyl-accepting chemotaxis protein
MPATNKKVAPPPSSSGSIPGVGDLLSLLGGVNPMVAAGKALETAVGLTAEIVKSISTFNDTMTEMNKVAHRVNALLDEIEEPVRDMVPLVQLSLKQAKSTLKKVDGVVNQVGSLPSDVAKAVGILGELAGRLGPLAQFAESAGGLFGLRGSSGNPDT